MKTFLLLVIVAGSIGGLWWWKHRAPAPVAASPFATAPVPATTGGATTGGATTAGATPVAAPVAAPPTAAQAALAKADALWDAAAQGGGNPAAAKNAPAIARAYTETLQALYNQPGQADLEKRLVETRLKPLGDELFFAKTRFADDDTGLMAIHTVAPGENPDGIAKKYGMSREFLNRLRGKSPDDAALKPGETLKVVKAKDKGGYALHVDKSGFYLDCLVGGVFARRYDVAIGAKDSPTPVGKTRLINRVWHPDWTHPDSGAVLPFGDPRNILGPMWLPLDPDGIGQKGIGIHGYTAADAQMGVQASHGCVRMKTGDDEELYRTLTQPDRAPTAVEIVD